MNLGSTPGRPHFLSMRIIVLALILSACVRSDESTGLFNPVAPLSCKGLLNTFDPASAPDKFPVQLLDDGLSKPNHELLERAIMVWENAVGSELFVFVQQSQLCDLTIVRDDATLPPRTAGLVTYLPCGNRMLEFRHARNPGDTPIEWYTSETTLITLVHELGHLLGLTHEKDDPTSALYPTVIAGQELSARSICAARYSFDRF